MTARDICYGAAVEIGVVGQGEPFQDSDAQLALYMLQELLNSADAEPLEFYSEDVDTYNFPSSKPTYTLGPGGGNDFIGPVPQKITAANIVIPGTTSPVKCPMYVTTNANDYAAIGAPLVQTNVPEFLYFNRQPENSNAELTFWGVPAVGANYLEIWIWQSLQTITALTDSFLFPPGYQEWVRLTLAMKMCRPYRQVATADLRADQMKAQRRIEAFNAPSSTMIPDSGLPDGRKGNISTWVWTTGDYANNR